MNSETSLLTSFDQDQDSPPMTAEERKRAKRLPRVTVIRRALQLTQEQFAERYQIPVGTLRDWEQERVEPEGPARAYLRAIAGDPEGVANALKLAPFPT